jgi:hypothetical protein
LSGSWGSEQKRKRTAYFGFGMLGGALVAVLVAPAEESRHAVHGGGGWRRMGECMQKRVEDGEMGEVGEVEGEVAGQAGQLMSEEGADEA